MARKKQDKFSVTKAVKANAREQVGQPRPEKVIEKETPETRRGRKHKETLSDLLSAGEQE